MIQCYAKVIMVVIVVICISCVFAMCGVFGTTVQ